ncbi:vacuolar protein sorting-associated protein 51, partial [Tanacetum coccineum]
MFQNHQLKVKFQFEPNGYQKAQNSMYILHKLLPFLKRVNEEQRTEMEIEARMNAIRKWSFGLGWEPVHHMSLIQNGEHNALQESEKPDRRKRKKDAFILKILCAVESYCAHPLLSRLLNSETSRQVVSYATDGWRRIPVAHDGPGQEPVGSAQPVLIDLDDFDDTTIVPNRRGMGMIPRMMSFFPPTEHLKKLKTNHEDFEGRKIANWIKHKEPREVHMFVGLFLQELTAVGSEVKHILTPGLTRKHSRTESNGSTNSSRSNTLRDNHSNTIRARSQLMETHLANLFKQKMEIFTKVLHTQIIYSANLIFFESKKSTKGQQSLAIPTTPQFNDGMVYDGADATDNNGASQRYSTFDV